MEERQDRPSQGRGFGQGRRPSFRQGREGGREGGRDRGHDRGPDNRRFERGGFNRGRPDERHFRDEGRDEGHKPQVDTFEVESPVALPEGAAPPLVKDREVVVPGQVLCVGLDYLPSNGTVRRGDAIAASVLGLANFQGRLVSIIPLSGRYMPMVGDVVVGKVIDILLTGWRLEINSAYSAVLSIVNTQGYIRKGEDLTKYYHIGDFLLTRIITVTSQNLIDVTMKAPGMRRLTGGRVVRVSPNKVPRVIGKNGSMLEQVKKLTQCDIVVGQNGMVWLQGHPRNEFAAVETLRKIEVEAHVAGLTQRVTDWLERKMTAINALVAEETPLPPQQKAEGEAGQGEQSAPSAPGPVEDIEESGSDGEETGEELLLGDNPSGDLPDDNDDSFEG